MKQVKSHGFTLIELLIVVAIIAILAAIAIPNFLAAQVRSKVSRSRADMRSLATAIESYYVDYNQYPPYGSLDNTSNGATIQFAPPVTGSANSSFHISDAITTPISYMSNQPPDLWWRRGAVTTSYPATDFTSAESNYYTRLYSYVSWQWYKDQLDPLATLENLAGYKKDGYWRLWVGGPDGDRNDTLWIDAPNSIYDPTNGTVSNGDIFRNWRSPEGIQQTGFP